MLKWTKGEIVENRQWTETLFSLRLEALLQDFNAGQFIQIAMDIDDERIARSYSLVNAPWERPLEIYFNEVPEGTPHAATFGTQSRRLDLGFREGEWYIHTGAGPAVP